jgi:hypothetical protein
MTKWHPTKSEASLLVDLLVARMPPAKIAEFLHIDVRNAHGIHAPAFRGGRCAIPGAAALAVAAADACARVADCSGKTICWRW